MCVQDDWSSYGSLLLLLQSLPMWDFCLCQESQLKLHQLFYETFPTSQSIPIFPSPTPTIPPGIPTKFRVLTSCCHSQMEHHSSTGNVAHKLLQHARYIMMLNEFRQNWIKTVKILLTPQMTTSSIFTWLVGRKVSSASSMNTSRSLSYSALEGKNWLLPEKENKQGWTRSHFRGPLVTVILRPLWAFSRATATLLESLELELIRSQIIYLPWPLIL